LSWRALIDTQERIMVSQRTRQSAWRALSVTALAWTLAGCSDNPLAPFEPEITNTTDSFQLQATGVTRVTTTLTYTWRNTGTIANVNHSTTTTAGSARLVMRSGNGTQVYDKVLVPSLNEQTATGSTGDWTIQIVLSNYSGTLNVRAQKP
jgi:hypothetical protein